MLSRGRERAIPRAVSFLFFPLFLLPKKRSSIILVPMGYGQVQELVGTVLEAPARRALPSADVACVARFSFEILFELFSTRKRIKIDVLLAVGV